MQKQHLKELRKIARDKGVEHWFILKREELVKRLETHDDSVPPPTPSEKKLNSFNKKSKPLIVTHEGVTTRYESYNDFCRATHFTRAKLYVLLTDDEPHEIKVKTRTFTIQRG